MKIYKFKDLSDGRKHSHFLQILLEKSIWCASPESLNDKNEFKFKLDYESSPVTADLLTKVVEQYRTTNFLPPKISVSMVLGDKALEEIAAPIIRGVVQQCRESIGITSFSLTKDDDRLWDEYGGKGNGVCVEINIPSSLVSQSYHKVHYVTERIFHVDSFLESALFPERAYKTYRNILLTKTRKWKKEEEIRFIGKHQNINFNFDGNVSEIIFGSCVPARVLEQLESKISTHCEKNKINIIKL